LVTGVTDWDGVAESGVDECYGDFAAVGPLAHQPLDVTRVTDMMRSFVWH